MTRACPGLEIEVGLLTGGRDRHYAFGLAMALISNGVCLDVIGSDEVDSPELHGTPKVSFLNLRGSLRQDVSLARKMSRVLMYYVRLIRYAAMARPTVFHILWNNKFELFDRTLLMLYYKLLGKKIALTAHNVNAGTRDSTDTLVNRLSLRIQYQLADHIFVHTEKMRRELVNEFRVREPAVTVVPYGINNAVPDTDLTPDEAKRRLGIQNGERAILFFGNITPYKGVEDLLHALAILARDDGRFTVILAGPVKDKSCDTYWAKIESLIEELRLSKYVRKEIRYIPDGDVGPLFRAADVSVLPYRRVYQSGVLSLSYSQGLPVIAADVGSLREDIVEGETGLVFKAGDVLDLAGKIRTYFASDLFKELDTKRLRIREYGVERFSWTRNAELTCAAYKRVLQA